MKTACITEPQDRRIKRPTLRPTPFFPSPFFPSFFPSASWMSLQLLLLWHVSFPRPLQSLAKKSISSTFFSLSSVHKNVIHSLCVPPFLHWMRLPFHFRMLFLLCPTCKHPSKSSFPGTSPLLDMPNMPNTNTHTGH